MAEYASAVVGIVAFGLEVCKGLVSYYESFKHQNRMVAQTVQDIKTLRDLLKQVEVSIQHEHRKIIREGIDQSIQSIVTASTQNLNDLDAELQKVRMTKSGGDNSVSETLAHGIRRLKYPFRESTLLKLREAVGQVKQDLSLAFGIRQSLSLKPLSYSLEEVRDMVQHLHSDYANVEALKWLHAPEPWSDLYAVAEKRHEGTGLWLLDSDDASHDMYRAWKGSKGKTCLWLVGFAGAGKSVLTSSIIRDVAQNLPKKSALAFFFFNFRDESKQSSTGLLRSLVQQLCRQTSANLLDEFHNNNHHQQPSQRALLALLVSLFKMFESVYVIVDAVDECHVGTKRDAVIKLLNEIKSLANIHLMITSRDETDIRHGLNFSDDDILSLQNPNVQKDIELFIHEHLVSNVKLKKWQRYHTSIEKALAKQSHGMFRWVECQFIQLEKCRTLNALQSCLHSLPSSLNETYDRIVASFDQSDRDVVLQALTFLCFSARPMLACELIDAMAIQSTGTQFFDTGDRIEDLDDVLNMLPGLLALTSLTESDVDYRLFKHKVTTSSDSATLDARMYHEVHFAHASVKDYFVSGGMAPDLKEFRITKESAQNAIVKSSLLYSLSAKECCHLMQPEEKLLEVYPFIRYAIKELPGHLDQSNERMTYINDMSKLFEADNFSMETIIYTRCERLYDFSTSNGGAVRNLQYLNSARISQALLEPNIDPELKNLLCVATYLVHTCVVDMATLVIQKLMAELAMKGFPKRYLSHVLLWLLSQVSSFANANNRSMCRALTDFEDVRHIENDMLCLAMICRHAFWGDLETVKALLPTDHNSVSRLAVTPVGTRAIQEEIEGITRTPALNASLLFLQTEISSPICCALEGQRWNIVQYFLDSKCIDWCKAHPDGQSGLDLAMYAAVFSRSLHHVKLLLQAGADAKYAYRQGSDFTALHRAAHMSEPEIVIALLDCGADVNARTRFGTTPLHFASRQVSPEVAHLLLDRGADMTLTNHLGLTCLHSAVLRGWTETIKMLLVAGANPFTRNTLGLTPRQLLMIHIRKWTNIHGLQERGPAAMKALEDGEKRWLEKHKASQAKSSDQNSENQQKIQEGQTPGTLRDHNLQKSRHIELDSKPQLDDVVDIYIEVPQILSYSS